MSSRYYKGVRIGAFGLPDFSDNKNTGHKKKKPQKRYYHPTFTILTPKTSPKNLLVMYDFPDTEKNERDWFRRNLQRFGFQMIQKSVWIGPSPLPKEFTDYLKEMKINDRYKSFKLAKSYLG